VTRTPGRWLIAPPPEVLAGLTDPATAGVVALTAEQCSAAARGITTVPFHELMTGEPRFSDARVEVYPPAYKGKRLVLLLAWLVAARLGGPTAWYLDKRQGPQSIAKLLAEQGWQLTSGREQRHVVLSGQAPQPGPPPEAEVFTGKVGAAELTFAADFGVFSPGHIDEGTRLLLEVALGSPATDVVADIGVGYGPIALGLVRNGIAASAVATDIDSLALWLTLRNAETNGVPLTVACSADPAAVPATALTVCNVPTHIDAAQSAALMAGLLRRAASGRLFAVVHASLESRYQRYFRDAKLKTRRHPGPQHVVFEAEG
jgi:16S rRNA (guanine1207-N2)-methyltransferase